VVAAVREALAAALDWFPDDAGNRSVLVGFSGGMDSTALLHVLGGPGGVRERAGGPALLAAHAFTWLRFPGSDVVFTLLLLGIMIPPAALVLPLLIEARHLGFYNDLFGLSLVYVAFGLPISILIFRGFFAGIPGELVESARLDGAREWKILFRVIVPVARPAVVTVTILLFLANWNDFILALVLLRDAETYTLPVGISQFIGQYATPHELIAAASIIGSVPVFILYLVLERRFQQGVTAGALKG